MLPFISSHVYNFLCPSTHSAQASYFSMDWSQMDIPSPFLEQLKNQFDNVHNQMDLLEAGGIANPTEQRQVGHYWMRTPSLCKNSELKEQILSCQKTIKDFCKNVLDGKIQATNGRPFTNFWLVGIGGSALGPQLLDAAFYHNPKPLQFFVSDNIDPQGIGDTLKAIEATHGGLEQTLVAIVSKSGKTPETVHTEKIIAELFHQRGLLLSKHVVLISCNEKPLRAIVEKELQFFPIWDFIGGRTSITSAVGLLPLGLMGQSIDDFLSGAQAMDEQTRNSDFNANPAALLCASWMYATSLNRRNMVVLPYRDRLSLFPKYLQQLIMESLGKGTSLQGHPVSEGLSVFGNKGTTDQHAYIQQLKEGINDFFITFIDTCNDSDPKITQIESSFDTCSNELLNSLLLGTQRAMKKAKRLFITITLPEISPFTIGALVALYERAVGFYAFYKQINAYDQPGVEAGKIAAADILRTQQQILQWLKESPQTMDELYKKLAADTEFDKKQIHRLVLGLLYGKKISIDRLITP